MINLLDLIIQWLTKGQSMHINISWWLDAVITLVAIVLTFVLVYYSEKHTRRQEERERAIDKLINSHKV